MKRLALAAAVPVIAVTIFVALTIPPARLLLQNPLPDGLPIPSHDPWIAGVVHVHTNRSDGRSGIEEIAKAAARAGLKFIVTTDHGDATATPESPAYRSGVLCVDSVEISTAAGHLLALDMSAAPYPLAGEPRDVIADVHRLGGFAVAAHPDSPKAELRWRDWTAGLDGVETLNLDTGWRLWAQRAGAAGEPQTTTLLPGGPSAWQARRRLAAALLDYPFRPVETIASLMTPEARLQQYHELTKTRRVISIAGADAHSKLEYRGDGSGSGSSLPIPGYESTFRAMSVRVKPARPFTGDALEDARLLMRAIRSGNVYTAVDALATPAWIEFTATNLLGTASQGGELRPSGPLTLRVRSDAPPEFTTTVWNGSVVFSGNHHEQEFSVQAPADSPGTFWVSIVSGRKGQEGLTWIRTNPIYVQPWAGSDPDDFPPAPTLRGGPILDGPMNSGWQVEHDPNSQGALDRTNLVDGPALRLRYGLAGGVVAGQFVGLAHDIPNGAPATGRVAFRIRSEQPMRISVQVRVPGEGTDPGERWRRSVYVNSNPTNYTISFDDFTPVGTTSTPLPAFADVRTLLFVIDTVNTTPGASGRVWISNITLQE